MSTTQAAPEIMQATKLSINSLCGKRSMGRIGVILGKATEVLTGEDANNKPWSALGGTFQGTNLTTGEIVRSGKLFLPSGIQEPVEAAVRALPPNGEVRFAMEFHRVEAENPIGYTYKVKNLLPMESADDTLADLVKLANEKSPLQLEAPVKAETESVPQSQPQTSGSTKKSR